MTTRVLMVGAFGQRTGYSRAFHDYCHALRAAGAEIGIRPLIDFASGDVAPRDRSLLPFVDYEAKASDHDVIVVHTIPQFANIVLEDDESYNEKQRAVCITTWEFSSLPANVEMGPFSAVVVPSEYNRGIFENFLRTVPVHVVPHGFDPLWWWAPEMEQAAEAKYKPPFTFYSIGVWCERKNPIGLLKAYLTTFTSKDDVRLVLVHGHGAAPVHEDIDALKRCLGLNDYPEIVTFSRLNDDRIRDLHWSSACFVSASRSEGFGLPAFEAMLSESMVITPDYGASPEFLMGNHQCFSCYDAMDTPVVDPLIDPNLGVTGRMLWGEPDLSALSLCMRGMHERKMTFTPAQRTAYRERLSAQYSFPVIGERLLKVIEGP